MYLAAEPARSPLLGPNAGLDVGATVLATVLPFVERALGVGGQSTSTGNILPTPTSDDDPFFPTSTVTAGPTGSNSDGGSLTKTILEWVFAIAALLVVAALTVWRYAQLRRTNQPLNTFLRTHPTGARSSSERRRSIPRTTGLPRVPTDAQGEPMPLPMPYTMSAALFYPPSLANGRYPVVVEPALPIAAFDPERGRGRGRRAVRGADTDDQGRRIGARDADDAEAQDDKDELPAYDNIGGPPKYVDVDMQMPNGGSIPLRILPMQLEDARARTSGESSLGERRTPLVRHGPTDSTSTAPHPPVGLDLPVQPAQASATPPWTEHPSSDLPPPFYPSTPPSPTATASQRHVNHSNAEEPSFTPFYQAC